MGDHWYRGYGLWLCSQMVLPEFLPAAPVAGADIRIRFAPDARRQWTASGASEADGTNFVPARDGGYVMRAAEVCDYWVRDGCDITLTPADGVDPASVRLFLVGSAIGMALHQRGLLVLHGATVQRDAGATIFVADSGAGKSTLAASLGRSGHAILGDDTMPVWPAQTGGFEVWPGSRMFKLWSDTIGALGGSADDLESVGRRFDKFFLPNKAQAPDAAIPISEIVLLQADATATGPVLEPIVGLEALRVITEHTYRPEYVRLLAREAAHFKLCARLAGGVTVARLRRPWDLRRIGETVAALRTRWSANESATGGDR